MHKCFYYVLFVVFLYATESSIAQKVVFEWTPSTTEAFTEDDVPAYTPGFQAGAPSIVGPADLDNDGKIEVILTDYSGGGRVHVLESAGADTWELIYSSPTLNPESGATNNARGVGFGDLDDDGMGEFYVFTGLNIPEDSPIKTAVPNPGLAVVEATGDNTFSDFPNFWDFDGDLPSRFWTEQITVADVDGDEISELLFGNNGSNNIYDGWYVVTASDLGTSLASFNLEKRWTSRSDSVDMVGRGGGSAYGIIPADLDGDGAHEIVLSSWNYMSLYVIGVDGPDSYIDSERENAQYYAVPLAIDNDDISYFGCVVVDIDKNGDHEVYCPSNITADLTILNYEQGEDPLKILDDNVVYQTIKEKVSSWGLTAGDIDQDGKIELIGTGDPYTPQNFADGSSPKFARIVHYDGSGDVEDANSYQVEEIEFPMPMGTIFDTVNRDSAGVKTTYMTSTYNPDDLGSLGIRATKFAFLGDVDNDGHTEVAMSLSGIPDSIYVYNEEYSATDSMYVRTDTLSATPNPNRVFMMVMSSDGISTSISNDRVIVPTDFELHSNYPNPFNPSTSFSFTLPLDKRVSVRIYDMNGRLIRTLINDEFYSQGTHSVIWNSLSDAGTQVASGQYIYTLEWGQFRQARRMVLVK